MKELKTINDFEIELPQGDIKAILNDPTKWAEQYAENVIIKFIPEFIKSKKLGQKLAQEVLEAIAVAK